MLIRLKLRLLLNRARTSRSGWFRLVVSVLAAATGAFLGAVATLSLGHDPDPRASRAGLLIGATALLAAWTLLPLLTFGLDESVDPARLVLFPLRPGPLVRALSAASLVGIAPAMAIVIVVAAVVGYGGGGAWLVGVPAMALLVLLCVTTARTVGTVLASGLSSRRGRDITVVVVSLLALGLNALRFAPIASLDPGTLDRILSLLRWLPPGMLGQAVIDARDGRLVLGLVQLIPAAALIVILLRTWAGALERSLTVVPGSTAQTRRRRSRTDLPLLFPRLGVVGATPWGAVAAKELRYLGRDPRRKVTIVSAMVIGVAAPLWIGARSGGLGSGSVLLATLAGYTAVVAARNQFGLDGAGLWVDVVSGDVSRAELIGKNVATLLQVSPLVVVVGVGLAAFTGGWIYLPAALLLSLAGMGAGLGIANVVSVRLPVRLPDNNNPFAGGGNDQGCVLALVLLLVTVVQNLVLAPVAIAAVVAARVAPVALVVVTPVAVAYGALLWWIGLRTATRWLRGHQPELLQAVHPNRSDRPGPRRRPRKEPPMVAAGP